jgi:hypothetical protein
MPKKVHCYVSAKIIKGKSMRKPLSSESGSIAATMLLAVTVVGVGSLYIDGEQTKLKRQMDTEVRSQNSEAKTLAVRNGLNRFRSLLAERDLGAANGLQPPLYPNDYFSSPWDLVENPSSQHTGVSLTSGNQMDMSLKFTKTSLLLSEATAMMSGATSLSDLSEAKQNIRILRTNYSSAKPLVVESIDIAISMPDNNGLVQENARLKLAAPEPYAMRLEISHSGANQWAENFNNIAPGSYDIRVLASGVVLKANVSINGTSLPALGVSQGSNPTILHQARNIKAVNKEIGRFTYNFTSPPANPCSPTSGSSQYNVVASLTKADGEIYAQAGLSDGTGQTIQVQGSDGGGRLYTGTRCYWMENYSGNYCWVPAPAWIGASSTIHECKLLDSCDGGGSQSEGGCYKWADSSDAPGYPWP